MDLIPSDTTLEDEIIAQVYRSNLENLCDVRRMTEQPSAPVVDATMLGLVRGLVGGVFDLLEAHPPQTRSERIRAANTSYSAIVLGIVLYKQSTATPKVPQRRTAPTSR